MQDKPIALVTGANKGIGLPKHSLKSETFSSCTGIPHRPSWLHRTCRS